MAIKSLKAAAVGSVSALALAAAGNAGAVSFQAGDTDVSIYGYVIGKASYDFDENLGDATGASFGNVLVGDDDDPLDGSGHFDMDASQSRIGFSTDTNGLRTTFEGDMRGAGGGEFRLRHAFGEWNGFLAGQTWSNYNTFVGTTPTIDFNGITGKPGQQGRRTQFRYTTGDFSVSVEDPSATLAGASIEADFDGDGDDETLDFQKSSLPIFTARYETGAGPLAYSVGAMAQEIAYEVDAGALGDSDDSVFGYGAFVGVSYDLGGITLNAAANYSDGIQSSSYLAPGPDAYVDADGDIETIEGFGGTVGVSADAGMGTVNVSYGMFEIDPDDEFADANGAVDESRQAAFANYLWSPTENVTYGVELGWLERETLDGDDGDGTRLAFAAQYTF